MLGGIVFCDTRLGNMATDLETVSRYTSTCVSDNGHAYKIAGGTLHCTASNAEVVPTES